MPRNAHAVTFGYAQGSIADVVAKARNAFAAASDMKPTGEYSLIHWNEAHSDYDIVARRKGLSRQAMPVIAEEASSFNDVSFPFHIDTPLQGVEEAIFGVALRPVLPLVQLVFVGDVLESLGASWVIKTVGAILPALGFESAILCDRTEDGATERRVIAGESLTQIIAARVRGEDPLPPPLLAFVKAELCGDDIWAATRDRGVKVRMTTKGLMVFSTVEG